MSHRQKAFDWQQAHARLDQMRKGFETGSDRPPEEVARILKNRAVALAALPEDAAPPVNVSQLLVFTLSGVRFGIETQHVLETITLQGLIPVPCTPAFVVGVVNYRGQILTIVDFRQLFQLPGQGATEKSHVVVATVEGIVVGIVIDAVEGVVQIPAHEVMPSPVTLIDDMKAFVTGVTGEMTSILNLSPLARDPRFTVNEEVI